MRIFEVTLEVENRYQSGFLIGEVFMSRVSVGCVASNEAEARKLIDENFRHRMRAGSYYEVRDAGEAPPGAQQGFALTPI